HTNTSMFDSYLANPGCFTYIHGDLSVNNLFVNKDNEIIVIDGGNYINTRYDNIFLNNVTGMQACDYYRFIGSTNNIKMNKNIDKKGIDILIDGFKNGYGNKYEVFTKEAEILFENFWLNIC